MSGRDALRRGQGTVRPQEEAAPGTAPRPLRRAPGPRQILCPAGGLGRGKFPRVPGVWRDPEPSGTIGGRR